MPRLFPVLVCAALFASLGFLLLQELPIRRAAVASAGAVGGPLAIMAAICNWDWWFHHPAASEAVSRFGRTGARVFYLTLGTAMIVVAIFISGPRLR